MPNAGIHIAVDPPLRTDNRSPVTTPVDWRVLDQLLVGYASQLRAYLVNGFREGFHLNFEGSRTCQDSKNLKSSLSCPGVINAYISKELAAGRIAGPFSVKPFPNFRVSPLGVVPKKTPGEYRVIHHLSYPRDSGISVNENIPTEFSRVQYSTIDDAIQLVQHIGKGAHMAKTDIKSAFRIIPIHPEDRELLGFAWEGQFYFDKCLPMGASSSCKIFETFSSALKWIATTKFKCGDIVKILDDFLFVATSYAAAHNSLQAFQHMSSVLGVPLSVEKTFLPATTMIFLGITLDSIRSEARLPQDKLDKAMASILQLQQKSSCQLRSLLSLIGLLNFACTVIRPGRAFLRRLINLSIGVAKLHYHVKINAAAKADLAMWSEFLQRYNGVSFFINERRLTNASLCLYTDAAGSSGYGAIYGKKWFYGSFPDSWKKANIVFLELFPIVIALMTWGHLWKNHSIVFCTDNQALVAIINKQSSKHLSVMFLVRKLVLQSLSMNIHFLAQHVPGQSNSLADALSRFQVSRFRRLAPHAEEVPTELPEALQPLTFCKGLKIC